MIANICHHKASLKGKVQVYNISLENEQHNMHEIILYTYIVFRKLHIVYQCFTNKRHTGNISCRLIAHVNYTLKDEKEN